MSIVSPSPGRYTDGMWECCEVGWWGLAGLPLRLFLVFTCVGASQVALMVRTLWPIQETQETRVQFPGQEDPWRRKRQPPPGFLPGKFCGQRSLQSTGSRRVGHDWGTEHAAVWIPRWHLRKGSLEPRNLCLQVGRERNSLYGQACPRTGPARPGLFTLTSLLLLRLVLGVIPGSLPWSTHCSPPPPAESSQGQRAPGRQGHAVCPLPGVQPHRGWELPRMRAMLMESFWGSWWCRWFWFLLQMS